MLQKDDGRMVGVRQMGFSLIRFDPNGHPDMKRFWKEAFASMPDLLDPEPGKVVQEGNVLRMEQTFIGNGGKWTPTLAERMLLEKAALGQIRPPELNRGWRKSP